MASKTGIVTASRLNLRPTPATDKPTIAGLARGTSVEILEVSGKWYRVGTKHGTGYVHGDYLRLVDDDPAAGFLHERDELQAAPLPPPAAERISVQPGFSSVETKLAGSWNRLGGLLSTLSNVLGIDPAVAIAVLYVESGGRGFAGDGRMIIRFENHVFWRRWGRSNQERFDGHFRFSASKSWHGHRFRAGADGAWDSFHGSQSGEWRVFELARRLAEEAAMKSISMGGPQIMGFNHSAIGYESVGEMFDRFQADVRYHILGLFDFLKGAGTTSRMLEALRRERFEDFASRYNGPGQAAIYGDRIATYFERFRTLRQH
ncbi:MAG: DUF3380 domain-containing protein [bacterium]|nr:DUF3380 domain-containing protein [bacterium]